jgi:hypothetical protein
MITQGGLRMEQNFLMRNASSKLAMVLLHLSLNGLDTHWAYLDQTTNRGEGNASNTEAEAWQQGLVAGEMER